ncbi:MAG: Uma2 family endonuclease [Bacteroidota bacterium]
MSIDTTIIAPDLYRWTVQEFQQMVTAGILEEDDKVELLNGQIVYMSPVGRFHAACVSMLNEWFFQTLKRAYIIRVQDPIVLDNLSEPEPDIVIAKRKADYYAQGLPKPEDVRLIVEVADSSLAKDKGVKLPLYAAAGIQEYWLINVSKEQLEIYTLPTEKGYTGQQVYQIPDQLDHELLGSFTIKQLFPWLT